MAAGNTDALELVRLRNAFYRDSYRRVLAILLVVVVIDVVLVIGLIYVYTNPPSPRYFATNATGRIIPLVPLDQPNMTQPELLQWATSAAVAAFSFNFVNYRQELQAASEFFTATGWRAYISALNESNNLRAVIARSLVVSASPTGAPVVLQQGVLGGRYAWRIRIPLLVNYQSADRISQQNIDITMLVVRISTLNSTRGIGIAQFVGAPIGPEEGS
ncbi:MAG: type IVB secretion system apparatus protein IcmL/DotI [Pseudomonadota bacterium]